MQERKYHRTAKKTIIVTQVNIKMNGDETRKKPRCVRQDYSVLLIFFLVFFSNEMITLEKRKMNEM